MASANNQLAKWVMSAAQLNQHTIYQHYTVHMQKLADEVLQDKLRPASIEDTIRQTFQFDNGPLFDTPNNIQRINAIQDAYTAWDRNPRANALHCSVYGGTIPAEMQVEGQPMIYWKGLPKTFTTCDYNSDEIMMLLHQKFCMGMPLNVLPRTLTELGFRVRLGNAGG